MKQVYPDISDILLAKSRQRRALAALSWEDKVAIIEQMRTMLPKGQWKSKSVKDGRAAYTKSNDSDTQYADEL